MTFGADDDTATNTISGTSMAAPHVAGVAALYLEGNTGASPATVRNAIVDTATTGVLSSHRLGIAQPSALRAAQRRRHHPSAADRLYAAGVV